MEKIRKIALGAALALGISIAVTVNFMDRAIASPKACYDGDPCGRLFDMDDWALIWLDGKCGSSEESPTVCDCVGSEFTDEFGPLICSVM